jgi:hypothetical protein
MVKKRKYVSRRRMDAQFKQITTEVAEKNKKSELDAGPREMWVDSKAKAWQFANLT